MPNTESIYTEAEDTETGSYLRGEIRLMTILEENEAEKINEEIK